MTDLNKMRKGNLRIMQSILDAAGNGSLTTQQMADFDAAEARVKDIDKQMKRSNSMIENRGVGGGKRPGEGMSVYTGDDRTEGKPFEMLRPDQSFTAWAKRRGIGAKQGTDRDINRYWAERAGLARPTIESSTRALGEDTPSGPGAAQAIVPQGWANSFIDLARPKLLMGRAGATFFPME